MNKLDTLQDPFINYNPVRGIVEFRPLSYPGTLIKFDIQKIVTVWQTR